MGSDLTQDQWSTCVHWYCPYCNLDTAGEHNFDCPNKKLDEPKPALNYGWVCPVCGTGNAPWASQCSCKKLDWTITWGTN
jgi:hypothetical protein